MLANKDEEGQCDHAKKRECTISSGCNSESHTLTLEDCIARIRALEYENSVLITNMSTIYYTAREEIRRRDEMISTLRKKVASCCVEHPSSRPQDVSG